VKLMWPGLLWGLLLVPLAIATYVSLNHRQQRRATRFGNPALWPNLVRSHPGWRRHVAPAVLLISLVVLLLGLTRPQRIVQVPREQATVMLAMDFSASMRATDVQPTRLAAARLAAERFIEQFPSRYRLGLVTFNNTATIRTLPTDNRDTVRAALGNVNAEGGTAMGDALHRALEAGGSPPPQPSAPGAPAPVPTPDSDRPPLTILLLSDGFSTEGQAPLVMAQAAQAMEVPVFTVAVGTQTGRTPGGEPAPPDEGTLRRIAELTGGRFFSAPTSEDLQAVYSDLGSKLGLREQLVELTRVPLAVAVLLFLISGAVSVLWFSRFP
jgi:Ca-activated chloride channel family protein